MGLFGKKKEEKKCCCCGAPTPATMESDEKTEVSGVIVLGGGCAKCHELANNVKTALSEMGLSSNVELISDYSKIAAYGVMSTPALVVGGKVVSSGKVLKKDEIMKFLKA